MISGFQFSMPKNFKQRKLGVDSIRYDSYGSIVDLLDTTDSYVFNIITKKDSKRKEALRLINEWNGISMDNIDGYLKQINELHTITTRILNNIEYTKDKDSMLSYIEGKFSNINTIIEAYNDYIDSNPLVAIKYNTLDSIDLTGVVQI